jgi:hypothetical protein
MALTSPESTGECRKPCSLKSGEFDKTNSLKEQFSTASEYFPSEETSKAQRFFKHKATKTKHPARVSQDMRGPDKVDGPPSSICTCLTATLVSGFP